MLSEFFWWYCFSFRRCRYAGLVISWEKTVILWEMQTQIKHIEICWDWLDSLFCQVLHVCFVSSQFLESLRYSKHWGSVATFSMWKLRLPELRGWFWTTLLQMQNPQVVRFWAAGALGVKQTYWVMAALSDSLEMHNSAYVVFFLLSFTFLYQYLFCTYLLD